MFPRPPGPIDIFSKCHFPAALRVLELSWHHYYSPRSVLLALTEQSPQLEVLVMTDRLGSGDCQILPKLRQLTYLCVDLELPAAEIFLCSIRIMPNLRAISLANLTMRDYTAEQHNAFTRDQAWQFVTWTLEAVPLLEHFATPQLPQGHLNMVDIVPAMGRLAALRELRSLELLAGMPWEAFGIGLRRIAKNGRLKVSGLLSETTWISPSPL